MNKNIIVPLILAAAAGCVAKRIHDWKEQREMNSISVLDEKYRCIAQHRVKGTMMCFYLRIYVTYFELVELLGIIKKGKGPELERQLGYDLSRNLLDKVKAFVITDVFLRFIEPSAKEKAFLKELSENTPGIKGKPVIRLPFFRIIEVTALEYIAMSFSIKMEGIYSALERDRLRFMDVYQKEAKRKYVNKIEEGGFDKECALEITREILRFPEDSTRIKRIDEENLEICQPTGFSEVETETFTALIKSLIKTLNQINKDAKEFIPKLEERLTQIEVRRLKELGSAFQQLYGETGRVAFYKYIDFLKKDLDDSCSTKEVYKEVYKSEVSWEDLLRWYDDYIEFVNREY